MVGTVWLRIFTIRLHRLVDPRRTVCRGDHGGGCLPGPIVECGGHLRSVAAPVHHRDSGGTSIPEGPGDRPPRSPGTDHDATPTTGIDPVVEAQRVHEAGGVGVVADE